MLEIEILKKLNHPNIVKLSDSGEIIIENQKYAYAILDFISGETPVSYTHLTLPTIYSV